MRIGIAFLRFFVDGLSNIFLTNFFKKVNWGIFFKIRCFAKKAFYRAGLRGFKGQKIMLNKAL